MVVFAQDAMPVRSFCVIGPLLIQWRSSRSRLPFSFHENVPPLCMPSSRHDAPQRSEHKTRMPCWSASLMTAPHPSYMLGRIRRSWDCMMRQDIFICLFSKVTEVAFFMNEGFRFFDQRPCTNDGKSVNLKAERF